MVWNINRFQGDYSIYAASNCDGIFSCFHGIVVARVCFIVLYQVQHTQNFSTIYFGPRWSSLSNHHLLRNLQTFGNFASGAKVILVVLTTGVLQEPTFAGTMSSCPGSKHGVLVPIKADESFLGPPEVVSSMKWMGQWWTDITGDGVLVFVKVCRTQSSLVLY